MDERLKRILNALPQKATRSCLKPYRELIEELRKMGRTLLGQCNLPVGRDCDLLHSCILSSQIFR